MPEVEQAVRILRAAHRRVVGVSAVRRTTVQHRRPAAGGVVHNSLTDSFLACHQVYGARRLSGEEADRFVREQPPHRPARSMPTRCRKPLPSCRHGWPNTPRSGPHRGCARRWRSCGSRPSSRRVGGLRCWPVPPVVTVPPRVRAALALKPRPGAYHVGLASTKALRWALASSPRWRQALLRVEAPVDEGRFSRRHPSRLWRRHERPGPVRDFSSASAGSRRDTRATPSTSCGRRRTSPR